MQHRLPGACLLAPCKSGNLYRSYKTANITCKVPRVKGVYTKDVPHKVKDTFVSQLMTRHKDPALMQAESTTGKAKPLQCLHMTTIRGSSSNSCVQEGPAYTSNLTCSSHMFCTPPASPGGQITDIITCSSIFEHAVKAPNSCLSTSLAATQVLK